MTKVALMVRLEAKKGKEAEVEQFLRDGLSMVENEPDTTSWYALRFGPSSFGIFDSFPHDKGRQDHLSGPLAKALKQRSAELFAKPPQIETVDVLATHLPETIHHS